MTSKRIKGSKPTAPRPKTKPSKTWWQNTTDPKDRAFRLRAAGYSYADIAEALGIHTTAAILYVQEVADQATAQAARMSRKQIALELQALNDARAAIAPYVMEGQPAYIAQWLKIIELSSKLLDLFAPAALRLEGALTWRQVVEQAQAAAKDSDGTTSSGNN